MVKPVVSAMNAWSWYTLTQPFPVAFMDADIFSNSVVVSVFAIIILSVIGGLFKVRFTHVPISPLGRTKHFPRLLDLRGRTVAP